MRFPGLFVACPVILAILPAAARCAETEIMLRDPAGKAGRGGAPAWAELRLDSLGAGVDPARLSLREVGADGSAVGGEIPVQAERRPAGAGPEMDRIWWIPPPGAAGDRRFRLRPASAAAADLSVRSAPDDAAHEVLDGARPVLTYRWKTVPVPAGIDPAYSRGDYVSPVQGLDGEILTEDYPPDHPHHRGVSWSWPVTRRGAEVRDIWAVSGVWSRPVAFRRKEGGPVLALLEAENVWKWGDSDAIVREEVIVRAFRATEAGRVVDIEVRLTGLEDGVAIGGRPHAGYGGFGLRGAPAAERRIEPFTDPPGASPRRSWLDYSGIFAGSHGRSGLAILEHPGNPDFPSEILAYPDCNYVMPAFPGQREVPLPRGKPLTLRHRLWIHRGDATAADLRSLWDAQVGLRAEVSGGGT